MSIQANILHCGACQTEFEDGDSLTLHLNVCPVAKSMFIPAVSLMLGSDSLGHSMSHLFNAVMKNRHLIDRYAACIAFEMSNLERMRCHVTMCEKLGLDHHKFKPFESESITDVPSLEEAKKIIWDALKYEMLSYQRESTHATK